MEPAKHLFNTDVAWDCPHCEFHNAFCMDKCAKCHKHRDFYFICSHCFKFCPVKEEESRMRCGGCDRLIAGCPALYVDIDCIPKHPSPARALWNEDETKAGKESKDIPKHHSPSRPLWSEDDTTKAISLSLMDQKRKESKDMAHWRDSADQKEWFFEEKHKPPPFSSWECHDCHYPNEGRKVTPLGLNSWRQRRLICVSCKTERKGHWRCSQNHLNALDPAGAATRAPSAHMCKSCDEETRSILVEYLDGYWFEKEEEEGWAMSLKDL
jgi:hypothetical protein